MIPSPGRLAVLAVFLLAVAVMPAAAQPTANTDTVDTVLLASTANYPDALVASPAANKIGAPVLLTDQGELPQETRDALSRLDPSTVVVVGGPAVVSDPVIASLEEDYTVTRLWGTTRYGTASAVAEHFWIEGSDHAVLVQNSFQDRNGTVLAAAKEVAREEDDPVYLTPEGSVPASVLSSLRDLGVEEVTLIGRTVSADYRSSLADIGISIDEEITAATDQQVREAVQQRVVQRLNATTDLHVVASSGYRQSIAAVNVPDTVGYHVTSEDDIAELVQIVTDRNVSRVTVAGQPVLAEETAERLRNETDATVHLVVARAAEAVRLNANLTTDDIPAFARAHPRKVQDWADRRERYSDRVQQRANHSLTRAQDLVDENASDAAREALHEAQVLYSQGHYVEAHEAAMEAINAVHAADYARYRDNATALQERVRDEVSDLQERIDELQALNREFAAELRENLTAEERLDITEEFRDKRREQVRDLIEEAQELGRTDRTRTLHERVQDAEHRIRDRSADGRFEARLACADQEQTRLGISGHDGYLAVKGDVALNTPNYHASQQTTVDQERSRVDITIAFTERDGPGVQCLGAARVERRVRAAAGDWTVSLTVTVDGDEIHSDTQEVTVARDDDVDDDDTADDDDAVEPRVRVESQAPRDGTVTVGGVLDRPGYVVVHRDSDGSPGAVVGHSELLRSEFETHVPVDVNATGEFWAMLHYDDGDGTYEFPGNDSPTTHDGEIVMEDFRIEVQESDADTVPTTFTLGSTDGEGCDTETFYYDGEAVDSIAVRAGTQYTVTFAPRADCTYGGGAEYRSDPASVFGTSDAIQGGETTSVRFTAEEDFVISQWWPNSNIEKGDIAVEVVQ